MLKVKGDDAATYPGRDDDTYLPHLSQVGGHSGDVGVKTARGTGER
jgi:hypothetical protein